MQAKAGHFRLNFELSSTADLEHNATADEVASALNALSSVAGGGVDVEQGPSDSASNALRGELFRGRSGGGANVPQLVAADGTVPLSGGNPASGVTVATRADGTPGGTSRVVHR